MGVKVYTSRVGRDGLDVSRMSGSATFAPSWQLLRPALELRRSGKETEQSWQAYTAAYLAEMRVSYAQNRPEWDRVLHMPSVTLLCYCASKYLPRCHRIVLAHLLTRLDMTAVYLGEIS
jgi:uncharacterized protein YeaO (DUF488 family)